LSIKQITKKIIASSWLRLFVRFSIGAVFVYAGFVKLIDPRAFARVISHYDMVPDSFLPFVAIGLPAVEFLAGLGLIFNIRGSLSVIFILLMLFSLVLGYGIFNDLNIDCGCFTPDEINQQNSLKTAFFRDLFLVGGAFFLFLSKLYCPENAMNQNLLERIKSITHKRRI
jgi:uncharacterized membrane protein YphA (DoxX/SURF4 family)